MFDLRDANRAAVVDLAFLCDDYSFRLAVSLLRACVVAWQSSVGLKIVQVFLYLHYLQTGLNPDFRMIQKKRQCPIKILPIHYGQKLG
jgi:hypothetical protein